MLDSADSASSVASSLFPLAVIVLVGILRLIVLLGVGSFTLALASPIASSRDLSPAAEAQAYRAAGTLTTSIDGDTKVVPGGP